MCANQIRPITRWTLCSYKVMKLVCLITQMFQVNITPLLWRKVGKTNFSDRIQPIRKRFSGIQDLNHWIDLQKASQNNLPKWTCPNSSQVPLLSRTLATQPAEGVLVHVSELSGTFFWTSPEVILFRLLEELLPLKLKYPLNKLDL